MRASRGAETPASGLVNCNGGTKADRCDGGRCARGSARTASRSAASSTDGTGCSRACAGIWHRLPIKLKPCRLGSSNDFFRTPPHRSSLPMNRITLKLIVPGRLPSWNALLALGHWQRAKLKKEIQSAFLSALRACDDDCSTKTTFAKSITSIAADTLESYVRMSREKQKSRSRNARLAKAKRNTLSSKS